MVAKPEVTAPATVADLKPADYNPRTLEPEAAAGLAFSMDAFGDISGVVYNARTGNLVSGHQRVAQLPPEAILGPLVATPDDKGTVGTSVIEHDGARWPVRIVDWDEPKEKAANLAANNAALQGTFTAGVVPMLADLETQLPELWDGLRLAEIEPLETPEEPTPPEDFKEFGDDIETEHKCPKCGYEWSGKQK